MIGKFGSKLELATTATMSEPKTLYLVRHGESTFNEWRKQSLRDFSWLWVRDPMIIDAPLSVKGKEQVGSEEPPRLIDAVSWSPWMIGCCHYRWRDCMRS